MSEDEQIDTLAIFRGLNGDILQEQVRIRQLANGSGATPQGAHLEIADTVLALLKDIVEQTAAAFEDAEARIAELEEGEVGTGSSLVKEDGDELLTLLTNVKRFVGNLLAQIPEGAEGRTEVVALVGQLDEWIEYTDEITEDEITEDDDEITEDDDESTESTEDDDDEAQASTEPVAPAPTAAG
jgi:hypothetical protein